MYQDSTAVNEIRNRVSDVELQGDDPRFAIEFAEAPDQESHEILFIDNLAFHVGLDKAHMATLADSDGFLTEAARASIQAYLRELVSLDRYGLDASRLHYDAAEEHDDEPGWAIAYTVPVAEAAGMNLGTFVERYYAPFQAAMINVSDPGTFNHPYLFAHV